MPRTTDKRERLIDAAKDLIHQQGFHRTTLADIAKKSGVPLGNVYYYFKTKEEIGEAVIQERKKKLTGTLDLCCKQLDPKAALKKLVKYVSRGSDEVAEKGCPNASLCQELDKIHSPLADSADECMRVMIEWASDQFKALGYQDPKRMGFEFIARLQGTMLLGHALHDPKCIRKHMTALCEWIDALNDVPAQRKIA